MNPSSQLPTEPTPTSPIPANQINITAAQIASVGRTFGSIFLIGQIVLSLLFMAIGGALASSLFDQSDTVSAPATITHISQTTTNNTSTSQPEVTCTLTYSFMVAGKTYTGASSVSTDTNCGRPVGSTITVRYNPADPSHNSSDGKGSGIIGAVFFVVGFIMFIIAVIGLVRLRASNKNKRSATSAQMELIANGFQELGDFWEPHHMTQAEAEQMITDINQRLTAQRRQPMS